MLAAGRDTGYRLSLWPANACEEGDVSGSSSGLCEIGGTARA